MFIVSKLDIINNSASIVDFEDDKDAAYSFHIAYMNMLDDCKQYIDNDSYSVKNASKIRLEITKKGLFSSYLAFVYEIHDTTEDKTEEKTEE